MVTEGIIVSRVLTGGPADLKGLKTHDQVVKVRHSIKISVSKKLGRVAQSVGHLTRKIMVASFHLMDLVGCFFWGRQYRKNSKIWDTSNNSHNCPKNGKV